MIRHKLIEIVEKFELHAIRLKQLLALFVEDTIAFLASVGVSKNKMSCDKCGSKMNFQKQGNLQDGIMINSQLFFKK
jgi:hypothetical protein